MSEPVSLLLVSKAAGHAEVFLSTPCALAAQGGLCKKLTRGPPDWQGFFSLQITFLRILTPAPMRQERCVYAAVSPGRMQSRLGLFRRFCRVNAAFLSPAALSNLVVLF